MEIQVFLLTPRLHTLIFSNMKSLVRANVRNVILFKPHWSIWRPSPKRVHADMNYLRFKDFLLREYVLTVPCTLAEWQLHVDGS